MFNAAGSSQQGKLAFPKFRLLEKAQDAYEVVGQVRLAEPEFVALDCEGISLSRTGALTTLQLATDGADRTAYIFDVKTIGASVFREGLKDLLESESVVKLMFDCRSDSDALYHQFGVKLTNVLDLQLYDVLLRERYPPQVAHKAWNPRVPFVKGMQDCLTRYQVAETLIASKIDGLRKLTSDLQCWAKRPIGVELQHYAVADVCGILELYKKMQAELPLDDAILRERLQVASQRYCAHKRDYNGEDGLNTKNLLPMNIMPEVINGQLELSIPAGEVKCCDCKRDYPRSVYSKTQLTKRCQLCPVCKENRRIEDVRRCKQAHWQSVVDNADY